MVKSLIESLRMLLEQSSETLGPQDPSTVMLRQQLAAALEAAGEGPSKVFWLQKVPSAAPTDGKQR